ncbi:MAG TPA: hypothetical protein VL053_13120 [Arachidicoccus sp.]|nr:hypothetical protein [Arachidicoccus sp.]
MKKFLNYALSALAFTLAVSFAKANAIGGNINVINNGIVKVEVSNNITAHSISISDANGNQLYELDGLKAGAFKNLDFSFVPDGRYFIKIENEKTIETTQVDKSNGEISITQKPELLVKPIFRRSGDRLNVYFMNPDKSDVQVDVYNENNVLVNTLQTNDEVIEKAFDFSKSLRGNYKVVLAQQNNIFSSDFDY